MSEPYLVRAVSDQKLARRLVTPRRGIIESVPLLDERGSIVGDQLFQKFGLPEFVGCSTAEMRSRPIPQVFTLDKTAKMTEAYAKWAPHLLRILFQSLKPPVQTFNKVSRLGYPYCAIPDDKLAMLKPMFVRYGAGDLSVEEAGFIMVNVRLQAEDRAKKREFMFVNSAGEITSREIDREKEKIDTVSGPRVPSRTRLIFNPPCANLYKQVLDTAIHNAILERDSCHHNMFGGEITPVRGKHICFDVKNFDRYIASSALVRAELLGGVYQKIYNTFQRLPFLVPTDDWKSFVYLYVNRQAGWSEQFGSGDSAVAPLGKEILMCCYAEVFATLLGYDTDRAINAALNAGNEFMSIRNYGDDNSISGDPKFVDEALAVINTLIPAEEEVPPKFIGFLWSEPLHKWYLGRSSYLTKTYLNERPPFSNFRKYPFLGWMLKRSIYRELGDPMITTEIYPAEDKLLAANGLSWTQILQRAALEREASMTGEGSQFAPDFLLDKDYLLTAEEKISTGLFSGMLQNETGPILKKLLGPQWQPFCRW